jgi:predicted RNase H-like nuclease
MTETPPGPFVAMGVDGARGGWAAACLYARSLHDEETLGWQTRLHLFPTIDGLTAFRAEEGQKAPVTIDVPIGLLDSVDYRPCDRQARELLGKARRDSVFAPPARYMLAAADYPGIRRLVERERNRNPTARGLSAQSAGIVPKVKEVDDWVRAHPDSQGWLFECHPELSFQALADGAVPPPKASAAGAVTRLRLIHEVFHDAEEQLVAASWAAKQVGLSDLLDAYAALSSALRCARGQQDVLGDGERDSEDLVMRMVR